MSFSLKNLCGKLSSLKIDKYFTGEAMDKNFVYKIDELFLQETIGKIFIYFYKRHFKIKLMRIQ